VAPLLGADRKFESSNINRREDQMKVVYGWLSRTARASLAFGMILAAFSTPVWARIETLCAPEIDPGSMASALTLLTGGMLILTGRKRRR
jgi:hypothetical protein